MALLDVCYPFARKAGVVAQVPAENSAAPPVSLLAGDASLTSGDCLVLLLPGALGTAINLCGVRAIGRPLEVREANVKEADVWIGLPRVRPRDSAQLRVAAGAGEWALYPWGIISAEGSLLLKDASPRSEGVCHKSIDRIQLFASSPDSKALSQLASAYSLEGLMARSETGEEPFATLCFLGGPGPAASLADDQPFAGVVTGKAVLGSPGASTPFRAEDRTATAFHRQAAALVMLYSSSTMMPKSAGALDTGAD
ncbi:unnamed protein product [Symbiodinium natans]|uniref:Uncharacterized protein n=1 Tax=Symbiodinium natans TaxID=878477 RepID=A0A812MAI0_9DINO|nr:unnamed protein product [Symbiodinium natans]